ncbi:MAG: MBL fold metallo-hydrolase [Gemmatimonadetes bacterium]|nr:MBL fold metallo-hydrolase [Gemmatimonadota bacterium]MBI3504543.1 MBL fold metallo-hydrolase [Pseudomonadota bacterium]
MTEVQFSGAAREVTGSCHIVHANGRTILLDCGLYQGRRSDVHRKNRMLPADVRHVDAVVLSHAHIDHAGRLPLLVRAGYRGPIFATRATVDLCEIMLADSAHIQEKDAEFLSRRQKEHLEPLYDGRDVDRTMALMRGVRYDTPFEVTAGVKATFVDAGHILGSASVILDCSETGGMRRLVFSGDIGRSGLPIIRDPVAPAGADVVVMESTYGNRDHASVSGAKTQLANVVRETAARGGKVLIPAFAVGRTQELVYDLHELADAGAIPRLPIVIDSPLATKATAVFESHAEVFDENEPMVREHRRKHEPMFEFPLLRFTESVEDSKALNRQSGPMVIIAASGMAESGRILHHLLNGASDSRNTVLVVGFMAEHTLGRRIVERQSTLRVFGDEVPFRAQLSVIGGYSAHADRTELAGWLDAVRAQSPALKDVWLVHGEPEAQDALSATFTAKGYRVHCPTPGTRAPF